MSQIPADLKYMSSHEWIRIEEDGIATIGITEHAQEALGDLVYIELPEVGTELNQGDEAGVVESVKAASDIYAPASGEVIEVNEVLEDAPEKVNDEPYGEGWIYKLKLSDRSELDNLLSADDYSAKLDAEDH